MTTTLRLCLATATVAMATLLAACGGGSDPAPLPVEPANTVPTSATASVDAFTAFTRQLISDANGSDTAQPLLMNDAPSPTSESAVPVPLV